MSIDEPGLALRLELDAQVNPWAARTALWSHPGIVGPLIDGDLVPPNLGHIRWTTPLSGHTDPFGAGQWVHVTCVGTESGLDVLLHQEGLSAYGLMASHGFEGRSRVWWERYLAEVAFAVHARATVRRAHIGAVARLGDTPIGGIGLQATESGGLQFVAPTSPALDPSDVRRLVEEFMCGDRPPLAVEADADTLEARWMDRLGWARLDDTHPLAAAVEVLGVLSALYDGGVLPEDGPAMLHLLDANPEEAEDAFVRWRAYLRSLDPDAREERVVMTYAPSFD